jgi:hypothetical protein
MQRSVGRLILCGLAAGAAILGTALTIGARADSLSPLHGGPSLSAHCTDRGASTDDQPGDCVRIRGYIAAGGDAVPGPKQIGALPLSPPPGLTHGFMQVSHGDDLLR